MRSVLPAPHQTRSAFALLVLLAVILAAGCTQAGTGSTLQPSSQTTALKVADTTTSSTLEGTAGNWTHLSIEGGQPPARAGATLVYEPTGKQLILFGGAGGADAAAMNDLWGYDAGKNAWVELRPSGTLPPVRSEHVMAYDPTTRRLILFGGGRKAGVLDDTWAYDPAANTWTELHPGGTLPSARFCAAMGYDPVSQRLIMFGGTDGSPPPGATDGWASNLADTWAYDAKANTWTKLSPSGEVPPLLGARMVHDPATGRMIMFGGMGATDMSGDTWAYDPKANTWTSLKPEGYLTGRFDHGMAYDASSRRIVVFGGSTTGGPDGALNATWAYDPTANIWKELKPATLPDARYAPAMAYDPTTSRLLMFGGLATNERFLRDTWAYAP